MRLSGRARVITGAGSGIGRASAVLFAREGAGVIVADWQAGWAKEMAAACSSGAGTEHLDVREFMEHQARCALCRAADESHFVTGHMFAVDGAGRLRKKGWSHHAGAARPSVLGAPPDLSFPPGRRPISSKTTTPRCGFSRTPADFCAAARAR